MKKLMKYQKKEQQMSKEQKQAKTREDARLDRAYVHEEIEEYEQFNYKR